MRDFNTKYDPTKVYNNSEQSESNTKSQPAVAKD